MRIFITGASGWIGTPVTSELLGKGHQVVGLARSDASAAKLERLGAAALRGTIDDLDLVARAAAESDGVIHLAFKHDIAFAGGSFQDAVDADHRVVEAIGEALKGSGKPFALASGLIGVAPGRVATEEDGQEPATLDLDAATLAALEASGMFQSGAWSRADTAHYVRDLAADGVRSSVVRLAPTNHGEGDHGFTASLVATARSQGVAGYIGDGSQQWSAVHHLDSAHLFCLALESAPAGATLHAAGEVGVPLREVAEVIGRHLGVPTASIDPADAAEHFGWLARPASMACPASSTITRELLGWEPKQIGLLEDLEQGHYFRS
jgi:nucleoside-diphosphate-sugar epimerase